MFMWISWKHRNLCIQQLSSVVCGSCVEELSSTSHAYSVFFQEDTMRKTYFGENNKINQANMNNGKCHEYMFAIKIVFPQQYWE